MGWDSMVSIETRLWAGESGAQVPVAARDFSFLYKHPDWLWDPPTLILYGYSGCLPDVKWPGCDVHHSSLASTEVKNEWSCTSAPPYMPSWW